MQEIGPAEERYKKVGEEVVAAVKSLDALIKSRYVEWTKSVAVARLRFFEEALQVVQENHAKIDAGSVDTDMH